VDSPQPLQAVRTRNEKPDLPKQDTPKQMLNKLIVCKKQTATSAIEAAVLNF
jgi:hypothetical protein